MSTGKKVLNVFGIIFAWILSIVFVLALITAPFSLSVLSTTSPKGIAKTVKNIDFAEVLGEQMQLSGEDTEEAEQMSAIMSTKFFKDIMGLYADDLSNALSGETEKPLLTAENIKKLAEQNMDELVAISKEVFPDAAEMSEKEIKKELVDMTEGLSDEILGNLPKPQELVMEVGAEEGATVALEVIKTSDKIKLSMIILLVLVAALIFVCRLHGLRGFRWLSVDLFVASGFAILIALGIMLGASALTLTVEQEARMFVSIVLAPIKTGTYIRTAIMLVSAIALMIVYVKVKKRIAKKHSTPAIETPLAETVTTNPQEAESKTEE